MRSNQGNNRIWVGFRGGNVWAATCLVWVAMLDYPSNSPPHSAERVTLPGGSNDGDFKFGWLS